MQYYLNMSLYRNTAIVCYLVIFGPIRNLVYILVASVCSQILQTRFILHGGRELSELKGA